MSSLATLWKNQLPYLQLPYVLAVATCCDYLQEEGSVYL